MRKEYVEEVFKALMNMSGCLVDQYGKIDTQMDRNLLMRSTLSGEELVYLSELYKNPLVHLETLKNIESLIENLRGELPDKIKRLVV